MYRLLSSLNPLMPRAGGVGHIESPRFRVEVEVVGTSNGVIYQSLMLNAAT